MECASYQFENRGGAKFCKNCGARLEFLCPCCGHSFDKDSSLCDECESARCKTVYANTLEAVGRFGSAGESITVEKVDDPAIGLPLGVTLVPALVIDGRLVSMGKRLTPDQIAAEISRCLADQAQ